MEKQLLFYAEVAPIDKNKHAELSVKAGSDFSFTKHVNSVPLTAVELPAATSEFTVVFAGNDEQLLPIAILGAQADENLYYDDEQGWQANYIPAFIRRYPFIFSTDDKGKSFALCIDEKFSGCNYEGRGERLFDAEGERTQFLNSTLEFLQSYQAQFQRTQAFCQRLRELDLFEPMHAQFTGRDGERRGLTGFFAVKKDKLKELDNDVLAELAKNDYLELIYLHLQSLRNFNNIAQKAAPMQAAESSADDVPEAAGTADKD